MSDACRLSAAEAAAAIAAGRLTSEALVRSCLARIEERDPLVRAWAHVDPALAIHQARERDRTKPVGPLHGVPIGIKDMIDTRDMPTQHNSPIYVGHRPNQDAACVSLLRSAGAVILGKTETHEFAAGGRLPLTRNPHDVERTPGGSSSGSAAAVADFMVPLALGTQTGGSTIRPASFCGIYAMKPTWGVVNREGAKIYSISLDTIGWFGRSVADLSLVAEALGAVSSTSAAVPATAGLKIALCRTPMWEKAEPASRRAVELAAERLSRAGHQVVPLDLPEPLARLTDAQAAVMRGEGRAAFLPEYRAHYGLLHQDFRDRVEDKDKIGPKGLRDALDFAAAQRPVFERLVADFDAVLAPSAVGEAPRSLLTTGDALFQRMWTLLHVPCITIPGFAGENGLPIGVTLVARRYEDAHLLAVGERVAAAISARVGRPD